MSKKEDLTVISDLTTYTVKWGKIYSTKECVQPMMKELESFLIDDLQIPHDFMEHLCKHSGITILTRLINRYGGIIHNSPPTSPSWVRTSYIENPTTNTLQKASTLHAPL